MHLHRGGPLVVFFERSYFCFGLSSYLLRDFQLYYIRDISTMIVYMIHTKDKCGVNETEEFKKGEAIFLSQATCLTTFYIAGIF